MILQVAKILLVLCMSLALHAVGLRAIQSTTTSNIITPPPSSTVEVAAIEAFEHLDMARLTSERVAAVSQSLASDLLSIDTPTIAIPIAAPAPRPAAVRAPAKPKPKAQTVAKATSTNSKSAQNVTTTQPAAKPQKAKQPSAAAQSQQAFRTFEPNVRGALISALRAPRGVTSVRAVVLVRFRNGRFSSASLQQSSGNRKFDDAVLAAAKKARYSRAPSGLAADATYKIAIKI